MYVSAVNLLESGERCYIKAIIIIIIIIWVKCGKTLVTAVNA